MREIKFRAWHPALRKMYYDCRVSSGDWVDNSTHYGGDHSTLMQYTGLHDKNGKEIYEGDILGGMWEYGYIAWCDKCKSFQYFADYNDGCQQCSGDTHWSEIVEEDGKLEVIGNIYENSELLK